MEPAEIYWKLKTEPELLIGRVFVDRYKVTRFLGSGGWSTVYEAVPLESNSPPVALKIPHAQFVDPQDSARFRREARALSQLRHANTVALVDFGILSDERPYIVTELAPGKTLEELMTSYDLTAEHCVSIVGQMCDVLAAAHSLGFVHRDLKPSNVIVTDIEQLHVKVIDFGAIKSVQPNASVITKTGETLGTPCYMSPEQCMGKSVDQRSDIYSLGCIMYEMLTGKRVVDGKHPMEIMQKQIMVAPIPFSDLQLQVPVAPALEETVFKCLKKDPEERIATMTDLKEQLTRKDSMRKGVVDKAKSLLSAALKIKL